MQFDQLKRREFIALAGMMGATWSFAARAQQPKTVAKIGFVYPGPEAVAKLRSVPFLSGLASQGLREREDFALIIRATGGDMAKVPPLLDELLTRKVDLLVVSGPPLTRAVHDAIKTLPIVTFDLESDPVESGWLQSYAHPGGNLTGVFSDFPDFSAKWLQLIKEIVPGITNLVVLWDPSTPLVQQKAVAVAAQSVNVKIEVLELKSPSDFEAVFDPLLLDDPMVSYCCRLLWSRSTQSNLLS